MWPIIELDKCWFLPSIIFLNHLWYCFLGKRIASVFTRLRRNFLVFPLEFVEVVGELKDLGGKIAESFSHYIVELSADGNHFRKCHTKLSSLVWYSGKSNIILPFFSALPHNRSTFYLKRFFFLLGIFSHVRSYNIDCLSVFE